jgi:hypothetical protein
VSAPFVEEGRRGPRRVWSDESRATLLGFVWHYRGACRGQVWWRGAKAGTARGYHTRACRSADEAAAELAAGRVKRAKRPVAG